MMREGTALPVVAHASCTILSLLHNLQLAYICRRRLQRNLAMDWRGTIAVDEEVL